MNTAEREYIIMASGEIITHERLAAWAEARNADVDELEAALLASGEIAPLDDYAVTNA